jgi:hypothetical protein
MSSPILSIITEIITIIEGLLNKAEQSPDGKVSAADLRTALDKAKAAQERHASK